LAGVRGMSAETSRGARDTLWAGEDAGFSGFSKRSRIIESGEEVKIPTLAAKNALRVGQPHLTLTGAFAEGSISDIVVD